MGCSSSQQEQHTNSNEAQVVVSNQNTAAGGLQTENESGEGEQTGSDLQEDKRLGISSLRENDIFGAPHKPGIKNRNSFERGERSSQRATVANAWGTSNTRKNVELSGISDGLRDGTTDFENEYGRDGVDMTSSKVTKNRDTDKENSGSPSFRTSPADQTLYDGFASQLNRQRFQRKEEPDEVYDPSALIDIAKFKAANPPKATETQELSENPEILGKSGAETHKRHDAPETVVSPSNFSDFYDEDEKELMESIQQNYVTSSPVALPGSII